ncbi:MucB/RseB C-terminal domain-containing protein [Caldimonas tepidiphila]|uniref:MucB/RseB C-terminal domain-containing protein n=1 Tax=Caldimonas tepidiphila TaxID=2315841 RepID=UPI000E5A6675|nr:MucB/RseB C-terminal domain-containing protein [Caldimonas tepidiphila]
MPFLRCLGRWLGFVLLSSLLAFGARAAEGEGVALDRAEVRQWLLRIHEAARQKNFQGTFVVSSGGKVASARIAHYCDGINQFERIESLDGQPRRVFRHNNLVHTFWPDSRTALVELRETLNTFPGLLLNDGDRVLEHYEVRQQPPERVAGHEARVLLLKPRDGYRFGYRLWSEKGSGLLLRAEVLAENGEVLESSAFSEVSIGVKFQPENVTQPMRKLEGYRVERPVMSKTSYESEGWQYRQRVPGFRHVSSVKRTMDLTPGEPDPSPSSSPQLLQTIFSDGLAHVSIFVEPFNAAVHRKEMLAGLGATQTLTQRRGDWWVTAVGEVPALTLRTLVQGLERKP